MIALLCAVHTEAEKLISALEDPKSSSIGAKLFFEGTIGKRSVVLCIGGMGKVNAAHAATLLLTRFNAKSLIVFGIGGAYPSSGAQVGDIALASEEIAGDEGVLTRDGFKDTEYIGIPLLKTASSTIFTTYPSSEPLLKNGLRALNANKAGYRVHTGPFVTLSTCTGTAARAQELEARHHGLCENMEGAAAAQVAELHGIPWIEVRGISNLVEDRDLKKWNIPRAAKAAQDAVHAIIAGGHE